MESIIKSINFESISAAELEKIFQGTTPALFVLALTTLIFSYVNGNFQFSVVELAIQALFDKCNDTFRTSLMNSLTTIEAFVSEFPKDSHQVKRFNEFVSLINETKLVPKDELKSRLEFNTLGGSNLLNRPDNPNNLESRLVRARTMYFYRQEKFTLNRESPLGYSFLFNAIFDAVFKQASPKAAINKVSSIAGQFRLEYTKIIDIILVLFAQYLETHYNYFLLLLSNTPYYLNNPEGAKLYTKIIKQRLKNYQFVSKKDEDDIIRFYQVIALMSKYGLVDTEELLLELYPEEDRWNTIYDDYISDVKAERHHKVKMNFDDEDDKNKSKDQDNTNLIECNQRIGILNAMLSVGSLKASQFMLLSDLRLRDYSKTTSLLICRLVYTMIDKDNSWKGKGFAPINIAKPISGETASIPKTKMLHPLNLNNSEEFYCTEWDSECKTVDFSEEHHGPAIQWLNILGPNITDPKLFTKLVSMAKGPLEIHKNNLSQTIWYQITVKNLLPGLPFVGVNEGVQNILYDTISNLPFEVRFSLYADWKALKHGATKLQKAMEASAKFSCSGLSKRLTIDNGPEFSNYFREFIYKFPFSTFEPILSAIISFDQAAPFTVIFKNLPKFTMDVFLYILLDYLVNPETKNMVDPSRLKPDLKYTGAWLRNLTNLIVCLCHDGSTKILRTVLSYLINQLLNNNSFDLIILSELLAKMGGIETDANIDDFTTFSSGVTLRSIVYPEFNNKCNKYTIRSLSRALVGENFLSYLIPSLCHQYQSLVYQNLSSPFLSIHEINKTEIVPGLSPEFIQKHKSGLYLTKVLSEHLDSVRDTIIRLADFTRLYIDHKDLIKSIPSLEELCAGHSINPSLAFVFFRHVLSGLIKDEAFSPESKQTSSSSVDPNQTGPRLLKCLEPTMDQCIKLMPNNWKYITPRFYVTFWQLNLSDIYFPGEKYDELLVKLRKDNEVNQRNITNWKDQNSKNERILSNSRSHYSKDKYLSNLKGEIMRNKEFIIKAEASVKTNLEKLPELPGEKSKLQASYNRAMSRLVIEKDFWFNPDANSNDIIESILYNCILPRVAFSGSDAVFCSKFIYMLLSLDIKAFSVTALVSEAIKIIPKLFYTSTIGESNNISMFLKDLLTAQKDLFSNKQLYKTESETGSIKSPKFVEGILQTPLLNMDNSDKLSFKEYRGLLLSWHEALLKSTCEALEPAAPFQTHKTITLLGNIKDIFPLALPHFKTLQEKVEEKLECDVNKEYTSLGISYAGYLKNKALERGISLDRFLDKEEIPSSVSESKQGSHRNRNDNLEQSSRSTTSSRRDYRYSRDRYDDSGSRAAERSTERSPDRRAQPSGRRSSPSRSGASRSTRNDQRGSDVRRSDDGLATSSFRNSRQRTDNAELEKERNYPESTRNDRAQSLNREERSSRNDKPNPSADRKEQIVQGSSSNRTGPANPPSSSSRMPPTTNKPTSPVHAPISAQGSSNINQSSIPTKESNIPTRTPAPINESNNPPRPRGPADESNASTNVPVNEANTSVRPPASANEANIPPRSHPPANEINVSTRPTAPINETTNAPPHSRPPVNEPNVSTRPVAPAHEANVPPHSRAPANETSGPTRAPVSVNEANAPSRPRIPTNENNAPARILTTETNIPTRAHPQTNESNAPSRPPLRANENIPSRGPAQAGNTGRSNVREIPNNTSSNPNRSQPSLALDRQVGISQSRPGDYGGHHSIPHRDSGNINRGDDMNNQPRNNPNLNRQPIHRHHHQPQDRGYQNFSMGGRDIRDYNHSNQRGHSRMENRYPPSGNNSSRAYPVPRSPIQNKRSLNDGGYPSNNHPRNTRPRYNNDQLPTYDQNQYNDRNYGSLRNSRNVVNSHLRNNQDNSHLGNRRMGRYGDNHDNSRNRR